MTIMFNFMDYIIREAQSRVSAFTDGSSRRIQSLSLLECGRIRHNDGKYEQLTSACWIFLIVERGTGSYRYGSGTDRPVHPGSCFLIPPGEVFDLNPSGGTGWELAYVLFSGERGQEICGYFGGTADRIWLVEPDGAWRRQLEQINGMLESASPAFAERAALLFEFMLFDMSLHCDNGSASPLPSSDKAAILDAVSQAVYTPMDDNVLAANLNMSVPTLRRKVRQYTGCALHDYWHRLKMEEAKLLLTHSPASVKQIAARLCYEDTYYFSRLFKKIVGLSPLHYREKDKPQRQ